MRPLLALRTARHVPPRQLVAWASNRLAPGRGRLVYSGHPLPRSGAWPALAETAAALAGDPGPGALRTADAVAAGSYRFQNREIEIADVDWSANASYGTRLWDYHLHYLDYAVDLARAWRASGSATYADALDRILRGWGAAARDGTVRLEPYPTACRILNQLRVLWLVGDRLPEDLARAVTADVQAQLAWLEGNIEYHLMANHLLRNLQALAWGGLALEGPSAERWRARTREFWDQFGAQVLPDGGHFERSPMYHAQVFLGSVETLALCRAAGAPTPSDVEDRLLRMATALRVLSRPDGTLHRFNDAADGQGPDPAAVLATVSRVLERDVPEPVGHAVLPETGYHAWIDPSSGDRLVLDAGPPGPACQPGHAHCDMLSFELDLRGRRVVVDAGVHGYDGDPYREYVRSTRAHNTVAIGGREQHEVWATFRMARRGEILAAESGAGERGFEFEGACRHYHQRGARHVRSLRLDGEGLSVTDTVEGARGESLSSWLHLHPDFRLERAGDGWVAEARDLTLRIETFGADGTTVREGERDPIQGWHCPEFGLALPAPALELSVRRNDGGPFGYRLLEVARR